MAGKQSEVFLTVSVASIRYEMRSSADNKNGVEGEKCLGRGENIYSGLF